MLGQASAGSLVIGGGPGAILTNSGSDPTLSVLTSGASLTISGGITIENTGGGDCIRVADNGYGQIGSVTFGDAGRSHLEVAMNGAVFVFDSCTIAGDAQCHIRVQGNSILEMYEAHTANGTFSDAFLVCRDGGIIQTANVTWTGTVTGKRYEGTEGGGFETFGSGATYFPGTIAGTLSGGAWYN
jgi:hypothetical protein